MKRLKYIFTVFAALLVFVPSPVYAVTPGQISGKQAQWFCESFVALTGYAIPDYDSSKPNSQQYQVFMNFYGDCYRWCKDNAVEFGNPVSDHINFYGNGADYLAANVSANHTLIEHNIYGLFDVPDWAVEQLKRYAESKIGRSIGDSVNMESLKNYILPLNSFHIPDDISTSHFQYEYNGKTLYCWNTNHTAYNTEQYRQAGQYYLSHKGRYMYYRSWFWYDEGFLIGYILNTYKFNYTENVLICAKSYHQSDSYDTYESAVSNEPDNNFNYGIPSGITVTIASDGTLQCSDNSYHFYKQRDYVITEVTNISQVLMHGSDNDGYLAPVSGSLALPSASNVPDDVKESAGLSDSQKDSYFKSPDDNQDINNYTNVTYNIDNSVTNNYQQLPDDSTSELLPWVKNIAQNLLNLSQNFNNWTVQLGRMLNQWFEGVYSRLDNIYAALLDSQVLPDVPKDADITRLKDSIDDFQKVAYKYFPFSVPWDMYTMISFFSAPPEAPKFDVPYINADYSVGKYNIDLTPFDDAAKTARAGMRVVFDFGLLLLFKKLSDDTPIG